MQIGNIQCAIDDLGRPLRAQVICAGWHGGNGFQIIAKRAVGPEARVAYESGVAASALPPQSKTRWLQSPPWDAPARRSPCAKEASGWPSGLRCQRIPINSNRFQSFPIISNHFLKMKERSGRVGWLNGAGAGWKRQRVCRLPVRRCGWSRCGTQPPPIGGASRSKS